MSPSGFDILTLEIDMSCKRLLCLAILGTALIGLGCQKAAPPTSQKPNSEPTSSQDTVLTSLQQADKLDGTEDHVVTKCYVCALGMEGDSKFAAKFKDYEVHLCSEHCKTRFEESPEAVIAETKIPDPSESH